MKFTFTLKRNGMQIGAKGIGNFLMTMMWNLFFSKMTHILKNTFHSSLAIGNFMFTNSNLELSSKKMTYGV
jgi:hypothetical protein